LADRFTLQISSIQDSLRTFNDNVQQIGNLHARSLNNMDEAAAQRNAAELQELVDDTSALGTTLKRRIQALERSGGAGRDGQIRKQQVKCDGYLHSGARKIQPFIADRPRESKIQGSYPKLPNRGAAKPE
jgi:hypothetical protein